jgi:hypothetical protein
MRFQESSYSIREDVKKSPATTEYPTKMQFSEI